MNDPVYKQVSRGAGDLERNCGALVFLALSRFYLFGVCFFSFVTVETWVSGLFRRKDHEYGFGGSNKLVAPPSVRDRKKKTDEN